MNDFSSWFNPRLGSLVEIRNMASRWIEANRAPTPPCVSGAQASLLTVEPAARSLVSDHIKPEDSVSQTTHSRGSKSRRSHSSSKSNSSIRSLRLKESLHRAALLAEVKVLDKETALKRKELEISIQELELDLEKKLIISNAT